MGVWYIFESGVCWKIRDGKFIWVWGDRWFVGNFEGKVFFFCFLFDVNMKVSFLIDIEL